MPGRGTAQIAITFRPDLVWREIARNDVVHIHDLRFALATAVVGSVVARRPRIFHTHGLIFHSGGGGPLKRLAMRLYFGPLLRLGGVSTVASSEADRALLLRDAPYLAKRTVTCPNAIPLSPLIGLDRRPIPGRVVSIGRIVPNKSLIDLVRAMARIDDVDWSLVLAGQPDPGELARLEAAIDELNVRSRVSFVLGFAECGDARDSGVGGCCRVLEQRRGFRHRAPRGDGSGGAVLANRIPAHEALLEGDLSR